MGEILADAFARGDGLVDGRVDARGPRLVAEVIVEPAVKLADEHEGVVAAAHVQLFRKLQKRGRGRGELARKQHLPVVALGDQRIELLPCGRCEEVRDEGERLLLDERFGHDDQLGVLAGDVEVLDVVAEVVAVGKHAAAGGDGELKGEAALVRVRARVHARFHHGLADGGGVEELSEVADGVELHRLEEEPMR